jgi:hypothetical protein
MIKREAWGSRKSASSSGIRDVQLAEACLRSAAEQKWISLDDITG